MGERSGLWICTSTGRAFYPLDPREEDFCIEDIATSLAKMCRFLGHCRGHYSVAEHSVRGKNLLKRDGYPEHLQRAFLLHDASEAYLNDLPPPLKNNLPEYKVMEKRVQGVIEKAFGVDLTEEERWVVKKYDILMLSTERRDLMPPTSMQWSLVDPDPDLHIEVTWSWEDARERFLAEFR